MLELLPMVNPDMRPGQPVPPLLESLVTTARRGEDLAPHVKSIVGSFGFDSFEYGASTRASPARNGPTHVYTTVPEWTMHYGRMGYAHADPRVFLTYGSGIPMMWDQRSVRGLGAHVDVFVEDARRHGIASGVSFAWHDPYDGHVMVAVNSCADANDDIRSKTIMRNLSEIYLFGRYFHELFMVAALARGRPAAAPVEPLSSRERDCLTLAAHGLTTKDISHRLDISSRTVQFHFDRIFVKLRASNRQEAVARAVQIGIVRAN